MEPITHALTSVALARAGLNKTTRLATTMLIVAGLASDVDALSLAGGAPAYLAYNRTVTHSLAGSAVLAALVAIGFWLAGRKHPTAPMRLKQALVVCGIGAAVHLLLDLTTSYGAQLLWPFHKKWFAWDLAGEVDPWILIILVAGLLLPGLSRLVTEEIGARPTRRNERPAVVVLALLTLYFGGRWFLHEQALGLLNSHMYHGAVPSAVGALPSGVSPLRWHGVVVTENTLEEVEVPVGPGGYFDPDRSRTHFKPESSPAFEAARATATVRKFLEFARFPTASVERETDGYRVTVRDLRFAEERRAGRSVMVVVELDVQGRVVDEGFHFADEDARQKRR